VQKRGSSAGLLQSVDQALTLATHSNDVLASINLSGFPRSA
jgi:hypothetical protein